MINKNFSYKIGGMSFINQRYCKAGKDETVLGETFYGDMLYIDGK